MSLTNNILDFCNAFQQFFLCNLASPRVSGIAGFGEFGGPGTGREKRQHIIIVPPLLYSGPNYGIWWGGCLNKWAAGWLEGMFLKSSRSRVLFSLLRLGM